MRTIAIGEERAFLNAVRARALGNGDAVNVHKAAVAAATTTDGTWAGAVSTLPGGREFFGLIERRAILTLGGFTRVPFSMPVAVQTVRPTGYKISQGSPKPVSALGFVTVNLPPNVVGSLVVLSGELLRSTAPGTDAELSKQLSSAIVSAANTELLDDLAAVGTPVSSAGTDDTALLASIVDLLRVGDAPVIIASLPWSVRIAAALRGAERLFNLIVAPEAGDTIFAVDPRGVAVAIGDVDVSSANATSLQMDDVPAPGASELVSMFQTDSVAVRPQMFANWQVVREAAVAVLDLSPPSA